MTHFPRSKPSLGLKIIRIYGVYCVLSFYTVVPSSFLQGNSKSLCCIVLSVMILKGNLIRASTMISIYDEYEISNNNIKLEEYKSITTENIKYYFGLIFSQTQFYLFYKSPDMYLYEENIPINYNILRDILKKYLITSSSSIHIAGKYYEEYSK